MNKVIKGDCLVELKELEENSIDSIVTDPPYELGFMGKSWDNTGIANNPLMWAECLRVLKPGGYLLSFGGTRTYHRMAVAIEDAGFEVRDMIEWVYGSGFPKSLNIGKAVNKLQGNEREITGYDTNTAPDLRDVGTMSKEATGIDKLSFGQNPRPADRKKIEITKGTSEWEGWGTALKPAHEPICMARKPLSEKTVAENVLKYGTGGINIDESRVGLNGEKTPKGSGNADKSETEQEWGFVGNGGNETSPLGRFPANLIHDNSEEVRECFPNESERFFKSCIYQAKASKSERNKGCDGMPEKRPDERTETGMGTFEEKGVAKQSNFHPTVKPIALMEYLIKMVTPKGGIVLDPFAGSGSTLVAAKNNGYQYVGIEMTAEYIPIIEARLND